MSYKAIIEIEGITREILNFSIDYFRPNLSLTLDKDTTHWSMDDYRKIPLANPFSSKVRDPFGGVLNIVMESTSNDDFFWNWFNDDHVSKQIKTTQGEIRIYSSDDEYSPMKRIEFWDCFVSTMSESFSSTGNSPMTLNMQLSPATVRFNKEVVFKKSWWWTDIDQKQEPTQQEDVQEKEKIITRIYWMTDDVTKKIDSFSKGDVLSLLVYTENYEEGETISVTVKREDEADISDTDKEITLTGKVDHDGIAILRSAINTDIIKS